MRQRVVVLLALAVLGASVLYFLKSSRDAPPQTSRIPTGPPPALPPGFPPSFPGAELQGNQTRAVEGGWQRAFTYTVKAKADDIVAYYRRALVGAGLLVMAEGGGAYGGMLRAQDQGKKRAVWVDIDAPEDVPTQIPKITVTITDSQ